MKIVGPRGELWDYVFGGEDGDIQSRIYRRQL